ncbi:MULTISPECIES: hypothetical protein [Haloarcula]|uniref:hypothetical protein n=1 Tax=Haloarcula TaxID=2237 RepID=UPI0011B49481|nr:hypothetical protein [Haloarcula hispanica]
MLDLDASDANVARAVVLPLDCSRKQLKDLLTLSGESETPFRKRLDEYCVETLKRTGSPDDPPVVEFIHEIATFAALAAVRVEFADPLLGTHHYEQFLEHSLERRMMTRALQKHPGLSRFTRDIRDYPNLWKPNRSFVPYFGAASQNPLVDPNSRDTISRPDKRLVTVADTIRASSTLDFDDTI